MLLKEIPTLERPREKALKYGIENLSNPELLAILLRTGSTDLNVMDTARQILYELSSIKELPEMTISELTKIKGVGPTKAITILCAIELGLRIVKMSTDETNFSSPREVYEYLRYRVQNFKEEHLFGLYLNAKGVLIDCKLLTKGTISSTIIDPKNIFKWAYKLSASGIILVHNHPSGDPTPSLADLKHTEEVIKQAKITGFVILDHIIIGNTYYSMKASSKIYKMF